MLFYLLGVVQSIRDLGFPISAIDGPNGCKEQMGWPPGGLWVKRTQAQPNRKAPW